MKNNLDFLIDNENEDEQDEITNENDVKKIKSNDFILFKNEILKSIGEMSAKLKK